MVCAVLGNCCTITNSLDNIPGNQSHSAGNWLSIHMSQSCVISLMANIPDNLNDSCQQSHSA